jgi:UDP-N-acetylglucosamine acyltransferase
MRRCASWGIFIRSPGMGPRESPYWEVFRLSFKRFSEQGDLVLMIHPTAVVHPNARLGSGVRVGPHAVIDGDVELGADCEVGPNVYLTGRTVIGARNKFHAGCVIGGPPQDLKYMGEPTRVRIGDNNEFREHVTVNRPTTTEGVTVLGSHILMMAGAHAGHDCTVEDHVVMVNCAAMGGHSTAQERAILSGYVGVHQFARVGTLSLTQGCSAMTRDLPPYALARSGVNQMCGLNIIGLRRAGVTADERLELKKAYHLLFRSGTNLPQAVAEAREKFTGIRTRLLLDFVVTSKRGVCRHVGGNLDGDVTDED